MKNLIVSIACILALLLPWLAYEKYSTDLIREYSSTLKNEIINSIESGDWNTAEESYAELSESWKRLKSVSEYFLDAKSLSETDELLNKIEYHISMHDASNAAAGSAELIHMFDYLHENEKLSFGNIF